MGDPVSRSREIVPLGLSGVGEPQSLDRDSLAELAGDYQRAAEQLSSLTPPATIADPHTRMVAAMQAYAGDLERASELTGDQPAFVGAMAQAQADAKPWTAAFQEIEASGYATVQAS